MAAYAIILDERGIVDGASSKLNVRALVIDVDHDGCEQATQRGR